MLKKLFSLFAALTLSVGLWAETIDNVAYLDAAGVEQTANGVNEVTSSDEIVYWGTVGTDTWYVVTGTDVQLSKGAVCQGNVHLILGDGAKLTATGESKKAGIEVSGEGNSLTIYGQTKQSGQLIATGENNAVGIGDGDQSVGSSIFVAANLLVKDGDNDIEIAPNRSSTTNIAGDLTDKPYVTIGLNKKNLNAESFEVSDYSFIYNGEAKAATVKYTVLGILGIGEITVTYKQGATSVASPINAGEYDIYMAVAETGKYNALEATEVGTLTIEKATPTGNNFIFTAPKYLTEDGNTKTATVTFDDQDGKLFGMGTITVKYNGSTDAPITAGDYTVTIDVAEGDNYTSATGLTKEDWKFTIKELDPIIQTAKTAAIAAINEAIKDLTLFPKELEYIEQQIEYIKIEESEEAVNSTKNATLAFIALHDAKVAAIEELKHDMGDYAESEAIYNFIGGPAIETATNVSKITEAKNAALANLEDFSVLLGNAATAGYNKGKEDGIEEALGAMAEPCVGCTAVEVTDGTTTVTLYAPTGVDYIKK